MPRKSLKDKIVKNNSEENMKANENLDKKEKKLKYVEAVGRRKTAVARVRLFAQKNDEKDGVVIVVNDRNLSEYFNFEEDQKVVKSPFKELSLKGYGVSVKVKGGGIKSQAEAIRLGIARCLIKLNPLWRPPLKTLGFLKRDPRMVERKKYGKRKARRPQQWRKR